MAIPILGVPAPTTLVHREPVALTADRHVQPAGRALVVLALVARVAVIQVNGGAAAPVAVVLGQTTVLPAIAVVPVRAAMAPVGAVHPMAPGLMRGQPLIVQLVVRVPAPRVRVPAPRVRVPAVIARAVIARAVIARAVIARAVIARAVLATHSKDPHAHHRTVVGALPKADVSFLQVHHPGAAQIAQYRAERIDRAQRNEVTQSVTTGRLLNVDQESIQT